MSAVIMAVLICCLVVVIPSLKRSTDLNKEDTPTSAGGLKRIRRLFRCETIPKDIEAELEEVTVMPSNPNMEDTQTSLAADAEGSFLETLGKWFRCG